MNLNGNDIGARGRLVTPGGGVERLLSVAASARVLNRPCPFPCCSERFAAVEIHTAPSSDQLEGEVRITAPGADTPPEVNGRETGAVGPPLMTVTSPSPPKPRRAGPLAQALSLKLGCDQLVLVHAGVQIFPDGIAGMSVVLTSSRVTLMVMGAESARRGATGQRAASTCGPTAPSQLSR
jgi:hypothetical protein